MPANRKGALAGMLQSTKDASKKFRKKDLGMAASLIAGASAEKARMDTYGTEDKNGLRVKRSDKPTSRDQDATRKLAKIRTRRSY